MELFQEKNQCCGCSACMSICPKGAIMMKPDEEGFLYPVIDETLCVNCGLCKTTCVFQNGYNKKKSLEVPDGYAVKHKDKKVRENSRSGGMFTALTDYMLDRGIVVYGAGYGEHFKVMHKCAETKEERDEFRGSKYVQSDMGGCFKEIKKRLANGESVCFSGTPCQTVALRKYCGTPLRKNLYLIDIVCHGVPSPMLWQDFLKQSEKDFGGKVEAVDFRNKRRFGWKAHRETVTIDGKEHSSKIYTALFYKDTALRPACYRCRYANRHRPSDVTLADFWGHEKAVHGFHTDDKGCSLVLGNTKKGCEWIKQVLDEVDFIDVTSYPYRHKTMKRPTKCPEDRDIFWQEYRKKGFVYIAEKYTEYQRPAPVKQAVKNVLKKLGLLATAKKLYKKLRKGKKAN